MFPEQISVDILNEQGKNTLVGLLDIRFTRIGENYLIAEMPVNDKTRQPHGILHGGASVVLAETLGSVAANLVLNNNKQYAVGLEINANHIRSVSSGVVTGKALPIHIGRSTQVWSIEITNEESKIVAISRITVAVKDKR